MEQRGRNPNLEKETWRTAPSRFRPRYIRAEPKRESSAVALQDRLLAVRSVKVMTNTPFSSRDKSP